MRHRARTAAVAAVAAWTPGATPGSYYPNQRAVNDPWIAALRDEGIKFWAKRGVHVPATTKVDVADDLSGGMAGRGWSVTNDPEGRIALQGRFTGVELRRARSKHGSVTLRRAALQRLGQMIFHELGHVGLGEDHQAKGLMSADSGYEVPWEAKLLAHKLIPRKLKPRR